MSYFVIAIVVCIFVYSIIPTLLIRIFSIGIHKKGTKTNAIALTFDDGPNPEYTPQLLDILQRHKVKATFFVVGSKVSKYPEIIARMQRDGHEIGIHHFQHYSSLVLMPWAYYKQMAKSEQMIKNVTNNTPTLYRPPWGHFNLISLFQTNKYKTIMWSHIIGDWKKKVGTDELYKRLKNCRKNGDIILLHDCGETFGADRDAPKRMLFALDTFLTEMKDQDIETVTISSLLVEEQDQEKNAS